jgi:hypothetical protein
VTGQFKPVTPFPACEAVMQEKVNQRGVPGIGSHVAGGASHPTGSIMAKGVKHV